MMKYEVVPNSCRICLRKCKKLRSIYKPLEEGDEPPHEMLKVITGITMEECSQADDLPKNICKGCELSLNLAFQFRSKALKSQRIIEIYCNHHHQQLLKDMKQYSGSGSSGSSTDPLYDFKDEITEPEVEVKLEENTTQTRASDDGLEDITLIDDVSNEEEIKVMELEVPFADDAKIEYLEDESYGDDDDDDDEYDEFDGTYSATDELPQQPQELTNHNDQHAVSTNSITVVIDDDENLRDADQSTESIEELKKELQSLEKLLETRQPPFKSSTTDAATQKKCVSSRGRKSKYGIEELKKRLLESKKFKVVEVKRSGSPGEAPTLKLLAKKSTKPKVNDESGHICDICGNIYTKRGRMMEHRRRHDKELRFACELCDKRFHLREKLRKHMFSHSGGKPYQCSYCSRTFFYESVKKAHEAVHKGVKPYICQVCNKAFAYSHALKKHSLIHADIKLYHCEYCNKDFRLQHHMKQHEETKLHQNAVKSMEASRKT